MERKKNLVFLVLEVNWILGFKNFTKPKKTRPFWSKKKMDISRVVGLVYLFPWKSLGSGKGYGNSRVEMSTRYMTNRINHHHYNQTPNNWNPWESDDFVFAQIHNHWCPTSKNQEICPHNLSNQLFPHQKQRTNSVNQSHKQSLKWDFGIICNGSGKTFWMKDTETHSAATSLLVMAVDSSLMFKETEWCPLLDPEISAMNMIEWRKKQTELSKDSVGFLRLVRLICVCFTELCQNPEE